MALLKNSIDVIEQSRSVGLGLKAVSLSVGAVSVTLGLSAPVQALEPLQVLAPVNAAMTVNGDLDTRSTRLQQLQSGARRAQLERHWRSQAYLEHHPAQAETATPPKHLENEAVANGFMAGDGVYLYGEQPAHDQIAAAYFVFETNDDNVTSAFYTVSSSFDCAQGRIESDSMQLTITDSYSQERHRYALGLVSAETQIASGQPVGLPQSIQGFYELPVREGDLAILNTCQAQL
ncbi:MAG: hypothetical protein AAF703_07705 [Cyanobacteria bacterium P01_D01_bin.105]